MNDNINGYDSLSDAAITSKYLDSAPINENQQIITDNIKNKNLLSDTSYSNQTGINEINTLYDNKNQEIKEYTTDYTTLFITILIICLIFLLFIISLGIYKIIHKKNKSYYNPITINILKK